MIPLAESIKQATSLLGLVACLVSCAGSDGGATQARSDLAPPRPTPGWVASPPTGCALGSSGPTLNPRNAIRYARAAAIEALAAGSLEVDVHTISGSGRRGAFEISAQSMSGTLADARVPAIWADTRPGARGRGAIRQVHALACWPDADLSSLPAPDHPRWLVEPPEGPDRVCAVGIAGPTWRPEDQAERALEDGRLALAIALESRIEKRVFDDGRGVARIAREIDPSPAALARAARVDTLEERWLDASAEGPLGLPGVLYGLACTEE
jgi:hypothetical protein